MAVAVKVPAVGESITEGVLAQWLKKDGAAVQADEPLFELETDKATQTVPAPASGVLHIQVREGEKVAVGAEVARIEEKKGGDNQAAARPEAAKPSPEPEKKPAEAEKKPTPKPTPAAPPPSRERSPEQMPAANAPSAIPIAELPLSPAVRVLVEESGIDINKVPGSGRDGRVTKEDIMRYLADHPAAERKAAPPAPPTAAAPAPAPAASQEAATGVQRQRMSAIRQRIGEKLVQSQQATATLTTFNEADMSAVMELRSRYKDKFKERHGINLGFMSFFVKACVEALRAFPLVNGRIDGTDIVTYDYCHIGVAVSTEKGLMVPVLRHAERLSFAQIEKGIAALAVKARDGKINVSDLQGGTFTITNGGIFGSMLSTPILNPPQSAILGMHAIQKRAVVVNDQIVIRPMMYLALSYDHRLIDGREAVQFLVRVKECLENPERLLLEI